MTKLATQWKTKSGFDTATDNAGFSLLLETDDLLLLETGDELLLEDSVVTPKNPAVWETPTKNSTQWGYGVSTAADGEALTTENGEARTTEDGVARITEAVTKVSKNPTEWS